MGGDLEVSQYPKVSIEEFLPELIMDFVGVPTDFLTYQIRATIIDICKRTRLCERVVVLCVEPCVKNYSLESPDCGVDIVGIKFIPGAIPVRPGRLWKLTSACCGSSSVSIYWEYPNEVILDSLPVCKDQVVLTCYVAPERSACDVDDIIRRDAMDAVVAGVRYRMYNMPNKPWSSRPAYESARIEYEKRIGEINSDRMMRNLSGPIRIRGLFGRHCI